MPRVQFAHDVVAEAEPLDRAGREVLHAHIGLAQHVLHQRQPARRLQVERDRLLVRVEHVEVVRIVVRLAGPQPPSRIAHLRVLDLHHFGAEPGERLGAGRSGLELGEIHDANAGEKIECGGVVLHGRLLLGCVFTAEAATRPRSGHSQNGASAMELLPRLVDPLARIAAVRADEAQDQSDGEGVVAARQFAEQVRGHRAVVQRAEPVLQPAQPADEAMRRLAGIQRREDLRGVAQPLGAQADRVQRGRFQAGEVVVDLRQLLAAACRSTRAANSSSDAASSSCSASSERRRASPARRRGRQARSPGGEIRRWRGSRAIRRGRRAGGAPPRRAGAAGAAPWETRRRPRRRSRSRTRPSRASAPACAASAFRPASTASTDGDTHRAAEHLDRRAQPAHRDAHLVHRLRAIASVAPPSGRSTGSRRSDGRRRGRTPRPPTARRAVRARPPAAAAAPCRRRAAKASAARLARGTARRSLAGQRDRQRLHRLGRRPRVRTRLMRCSPATARTAPFSRVMPTGPCSVARPRLAARPSNAASGTSGSGSAWPSADAVATGRQHRRRRAGRPALRCRAAAAPAATAGAARPAPVPAAARAAIGAVVPDDAHARGCAPCRSLAARAVPAGSGAAASSGSRPSSSSMRSGRRLRQIARRQEPHQPVAAGIELPPLRRRRRTRPAQRWESRRASRRAVVAVGGGAGQQHGQLVHAGIVADQHARCARSRSRRAGPQAIAARSPGRASPPAPPAACRPTAPARPASPACGGTARPARRPASARGPASPGAWRRRRGVLACSAADRDPPVSGRPRTTWRGAEAGAGACGRRSGAGRRRSCHGAGCRWLTAVGGGLRRAGLGRAGHDLDRLRQPACWRRSRRGPTPFASARTSVKMPTFCWQNSVPCRIPLCDWVFARLVM